MEKNVVEELSKKYDKKKELVGILFLSNEIEGIDYIESRITIEEFFADKLQTNNKKRIE